MFGPPTIDVVVLTPDEGPLCEAVRQALESQVGVVVRLHRVIGRPQSGDDNRWATIARARNQAIERGQSPWVMFVDADVVLPQDGIARLLSELMRRPNYAALAADYLDDSHRPRPRGHVGMGAMLIRRSVLAVVRFRWSEDRCECQCFCDDLRSLGWGVDYAAGLRAQHLKDATVAHPTASQEGAALGPQILVALDRRHLAKFRRQFLGSLRAGGNDFPVHVVAYGFYPSELGRTALLPQVKVYPLPINGVMPPIRRLRDFQPIVAAFPSSTPVAYWDAGDVIFQSSLDPLWKLVREHPGRLLACREPKSHPANPAVAAWTLSIHDPECRRRAFDLLTNRPFLNSGFAAGDAAAMLHYLQSADHSLHSRDLAGTSDWGDQAALNFYCHSNPARWHEIDEGWNYCLHDRAWQEVVVAADGRMMSRRGVPIYAAHGNARSERKFALSFQDVT